MDGPSNTWTNIPVVALYRMMAPSYDSTASKLCWTFPPTSFAMYGALNAMHDIELVCGWDNGTVAVCIVRCCRGGGYFVQEGAIVSASGGDV